MYISCIQLADEFKSRIKPRANFMHGFLFIKLITNMAKPYIETIVGEGWIMREFSDVDKAEMQWHIDDETRLIYIDNPTDWKFQYDNALPFLMKTNTIYTIPKGKYHRLLAGTGKLFVFIKPLL